MFTVTKTFQATTCVVFIGLLSACAGMSAQEKSTAIGAGAGEISESTDRSSPLSRP